MGRPIRDQVIVTKEETAKQTASGLHLVTLEEKNVTGTVVAVGSGRLTTAGTVIPLEVKPGDKVLFNKSLATEVKDGDQTFLVIREDNIVYVF